MRVYRSQSSYTNNVCFSFDSENLPVKIFSPAHLHFATLGWGTSDLRYNNDCTLLCVLTYYVRNDLNVLCFSIPCPFHRVGIAPIVQPAEDICVSVIGLIVALVITALLALVAVAVAVSCWLMAYRRTPNVNGPLPHPTQVPNPMFMNHDQTSEPSPDYLT